MGQGRPGQPLVRLIIVDASVLLKWVLPAEREEYAAKALAIRKAFEDARLDLILPSLWFYEVGNILAIKYPSDAANRLGSLVRMRIPEARPNMRWRNRILELVSSCKVTFYDASYHALAIVNDGVFITADEKYLDKIGESNHVLHLKEWQ